MKNIKNIIPYTLIITLAFFASCKKDNKTEESVSGNGSLVIHLDNKVGTNDLVFGTRYINGNGDTMNFSKFNYYVSNFKFTKADGTTYTVPKDSSYFLVKHDDEATKELTFNNVPAGDYTSVSFVIGVDSLKSTAPTSERTGVLDPTAGASGMYWMWNSGYIFVKVEGTSPQAPIDTPTNSRPFAYHIGLFGGYSSKTLNNIRTVSLTIPNNESAQVRTTKTPEIHTYVDLMQMFNTPTKISVAANPVVMVSPYSPTLANNYINMFSINHVHN